MSPSCLNILDSLATDDRFIDLRKRTRSHRILTKVEEATEEYRQAVARRTARSSGTRRCSRSKPRARNSARRCTSWRTARTSIRACSQQLVQREQIRLERERDVKISALEKDRGQKRKTERARAGGPDSRRAGPLQAAGRAAAADPAGAAWRSSSSSIAARRNKKASTSAACATAKPRKTQTSHRAEATMQRTTYSTTKENTKITREDRSDQIWLHLLLTKSPFMHGSPSLCSSCSLWFK